MKAAASGQGGFQVKASIEEEESDSDDDDDLDGLEETRGVIHYRIFFFIFDEKLLI